MTGPETTSGMVYPDPSHDAAEDEVRARVSARSVAVWGARATGGLVGVGISAAVVVAAVLVAPPSWSVVPATVEVVPDPAQQVLVCPGSLLRLADDAGANANRATPIGDGAFVRFAATSGDLVQSAIAQSDAGTGGTADAPQLALVTPVGAEAPVTAGIESSRITGGAGGVVGYAAASCAQPSLRSWVVGGSTQLGRTSILTLVNPSSVEATVSLDLVGELGPVDAAGLDGIVVPPGSQRVIPVSGFALEQRAPVIGIESTGGSVVAYLQQSILRTLTPGGVDLVGQQDPSTTLVIPGVVVAGEPALAAVNKTPIDQDDTRPTLRLFAPGGVAVDATVAIIPTGSTLSSALANPRQPVAEGPTDAHDEEPPAAPVAESIAVHLAAGAVAEVPIDRVAAGEYTIVVQADRPLVGGVRASVADRSGVDFAWFSPAAELGERAVLVAPDGTAVALAIANPTAADRTVTMAGPAGEIEIAVPAGTTTLAPLQAATEYALDGMAGLRAAVRATGGGTLAQAPLLPQAPLAQPVRVHP